METSSSVQAPAEVVKPCAIQAVEVAVMRPSGEEEVLSRTSSALPVGSPRKANAAIANAGVRRKRWSCVIIVSLLVIVVGE